MIDGKALYRRFVRVGAVLLTLLAVWVAPARSAIAEKVEFHILAQSASSALRLYGEQAGVQLLFSQEIVAGIKTPAVVGELEPEDALLQLLKDTGLRAIVSDGVIVVKRASKDSADRHAADLDNGAKIERDGGLLRLAQDTSQVPPMTSDSESGQETKSKLEEIVVSAQKKGEERLQDTPIPMSVLSTDVLANTGQVELRDYYTSIPGLTVTSDTSMGQEIGIRGIWETSAIPTVAVLIDNIPFSGSTPLGGNTQIDIDPGDLARLEVLRGPQGTLYGANTMGGLLRYVTIDPSVTAGLTGRMEVGTSDVYNGAEPGYNVRGSVNIPLTGDLSMRASAFTRQDPGYIDNVFQHIRGINKVEAYGARTSLLWEPSDAIYLKLSATYQNTRGDGLSEIIRNVNGYSTTFANSFPAAISGALFPTPGNLQQNYVGGVDRYSVKVQVYTAALKLNLGAVDFTSDTGYVIQRSEAPFDFTPFFGPAFIAANDGVYGAPMVTQSNLNKVSEEMRFSGHLGQNTDWVAGGFYTDETGSPIQRQVVSVADQNTGEPVGDWYNGVTNDRFKQYAGFADLTYRFSRQLDLQVGVRETHTEENRHTVQGGPVFETTTPQIVKGDTSNNSFTYLFTPRFKLSDDVMAYARLASGFRPGGINALPPSLIGAAPSSFGPDKTYNYEAGLKGDFLDRRLSIDTSVYYINWQGMQIQLTENGFGVIANAGSAKSEGVEFAFHATPLLGLTISGWLDYDNAVLMSNFPASSTAYGVEGEELPSTSKWSAQLAVRQSFPLSREITGFVSADANYVGDRMSNFAPCASSSTTSCAPSPREELPAYTKVDLRAGVEYGSWTTSLYVNNIGNSQGIVNGGLGYFTPYVYIIIPPRTVGLSVVKVF